MAFRKLLRYGKKNTPIINVLGFDILALEKNGWELIPTRFPITDEPVYRKQKIIKDLDGANYYLNICLRQHEDIAFIYVNNEWMGRVSTIEQANAIAKAIFNNIS